MKTEDLILEIVKDIKVDMNRQFNEIDKRFEQVDRRFEHMDKRFDRLEDDVRADKNKLQKVYENNHE